MRLPFILLLTTATISIGTGALLATPAAQGQSAAAAPARYEMDAGTVTGLAGMATGGRVNPLDMMRSRRGEVQHELFLRLGSGQTPAAGTMPQADHYMPEGARLGVSVPLVTPTAAPADDGDRIPGERGERPQGRMLIFWGCGAHAGLGQPVIIDFARLAAGQIPPGLFTSSVPRDRSVSFANSRTYGDWPNARSRTTASPQSSLIGAHRISGNYAPEIAFTLDQDFMPALTATGTTQPDQSTLLGWNSVAGATGYYAWVMGTKSNGRGAGGDIVWWSSSASQQFGGGLWDWISPAQVASLIRQTIVMPPTQTQCVVPAEVKAAAPEFMLGNLYAYGPEANFAFPPRPANSRTPWRPIWTARARYRATTSWLIGGPDGMGEAPAPGAEGQAAPSPDPRCRRRGGLGGVIGRVVRLPGC